MSMQVYQPQGSIGDVTIPIAKFIHLIGEYLIEDDKDDIGKTVYYGDVYHEYHGEIHPDHPGFMHHWMIGGFMVATGQALGTISVVKEMVRNMQSGNGMDMDLDFVPLPGGKRIPRMRSQKVIPIPYREVKQKMLPSPAPQDKFQRMMRMIDKV